MARYSSASGGEHSISSFSSRASAASALAISISATCLCQYGHHIRSMDRNILPVLDLGIDWFDSFTAAPKKSLLQVDKPLKRSE
jgi:hypothetical protein